MADPLRTLSADIRRAVRTTGARAQVVVRKTAVDITSDAKRIAFQKGVHDTGDLIESISHSDLRHVGRSGTLSVDIGPTVEYGEWNEIGTSRMPPRPYMGPAADRHAPLFEEAMAQLGMEGLGG